ncbi:hypothetical protein WSM22_30430 [Cytophagales bacterium WSM2-2]|nr:hypothetical protein WSM22_30430 [Cytophagales bacterium WSM2-2]
MSDQQENLSVKRSITLPENSKLTEEAIKHLDRILVFASPEEYRDTLIEIYHSYIIHEHSMPPANFEQMANQMYFLMDFLKRVGSEVK